MWVRGSMYETSVVATGLPVKRLRTCLLLVYYYARYIDF